MKLEELTKPDLNWKVLNLWNLPAFLIVMSYLIAQLERLWKV